MARRMDLSVSVRMLSQVAGEEAAARGHDAVEPEHYLLAGLKLAAVPENETAGFSSGESARVRLQAELNAMRQVFKERSIDPADGLRRLSAELGDDTYPHSGNPVGDSERTGRVFVSLESRFPGQSFGADQLVGALLSHPSHTAARALRIGTSGVAYMKSQCWDWTQMAEDGELHPPARRSDSDRTNGDTRIGGLPAWLSPEAVSLIHALARDSRGCVFLISEDCFEAGEPVSELAFALMDGKAPAPLKSARLLILPSEKSAGSDLPAERDLFSRLAREAASMGDVVLYIEGLDTPRSEREEQRCEALAESVLDSGAWCICGVSPRAYEQLIAADASWRTCSAAIWLPPKGIPEEIPWEL